MRIALEYRQTFHKDVVLDVVGFRRLGHNETDEPSYTQPLMYQRVKEHPGVRAVYAKRLVKEGLFDEAGVNQLIEERIRR
jgi:2-oxoglutarate dehydrogenase E1 component